MIEEKYDPNWVFRDFIATAPSFFLDDEIVVAITECTGQTTVYNSKNITRTIFNTGRSIYSSVKQKTEERLIVNGLLRYTENSNASTGTVPICLTDLIVLTYITGAATAHKRTQDTLYRVSMGIDGVRKWFFGFFTHTPDNNLLSRLGEEVQHQYNYIDIALLRRCYSYLTNCYTNGYVSLDEYKELCELYLLKSRCDYIKRLCVSYHPLFAGQTIGDIVCKMGNSRFADDVTSYFREKYNNYQQLLVFSPKLLDYYRKERVFQQDTAFYVW